MALVFVKEVVKEGIKKIGEKAMIWLTAGGIGYEIGHSQSAEEKQTFYNTTVEKIQEKHENIILNSVVFFLIFITFCVVLAIFTKLCCGKSQVIDIDVNNKQTNSNNNNTSDIPDDEFIA